MLVADDHPLFRQGVTRGINRQPELELVGEAGDGRTALDEIERLVPDVAVVDLRLPRKSGIEVTDALPRHQSTTRVVILSAFSESEMVYQAVAAGAAAYVSKEESPAVLYRTIVAVARGATVLPESLHAGIASGIRRHSAAERSGLTQRELEVLALASEGLTIRQTADRLFLSEATIKTHLRKIYAKLEVPDRSAAVAKALRTGVLR